MSGGPDPELAPLTPTTTRQLLDAHGLAPRRTDGQSFLVDPNLVERIVTSAALPAGAHVLEVGPGLGALTRGLLRAGHGVTAIEIDAGFVRVLAETLGGHERLHVVHADAMEADLDGLLADVRPPAADGARSERRAVPVVANLPYNVATPLLFHLLAARTVGDMLLMVQAEVGDRWTAMPGERSYGAVSLKLALLADAEAVFRVPPSVFLPVPRVDSVMVRVVRRSEAPDDEARARVLRLVDECFRQPRKTLRNNLLVTRPTDAVDAALEAAGLDPAVRPGRLGTSEVLALDAALGVR